MIRDEADRAVAIEGTSVDVTRIKRAEEEPRTSKELLELAMQLSTYSVFEREKLIASPSITSTGLVSFQSSPLFVSSMLTGAPPSGEGT